MTTTSPVEPILEPELPIVDPHHHLWFMPDANLKAIEAQASLIAAPLGRIYRRNARYLFDELLADLCCGHNIRATVFNDSGAMYRKHGPTELKSLGEVEFVNGVAAMADSGLFGEVKVCAGIVGGADLMMGDEIEPVLRAHIQAAGSRYKGIRYGTLYDDDKTILGGGVAHQLLDSKFREGYKWIHRLGLSFDALLLEPQLPDLIDLARAFPETQIVLNHLGTPVGIGRYQGMRDDRFGIWRDNMRILAKCENVAVKLGGFGVPFGGFRSFMASPSYNSEQLAAEWKPYVETCIESFGADRCMFESNFPVDSSVCTYRVLWNAFKRLTAGASSTEKAALFCGTANRIYRLAL